MNQQKTMYQIPRDPDLHPMLSISPKDGSASDHASNSKGSTLTSYVVNTIKRWISKLQCIKSKRSRLTCYVVNATKGWISKWPCIKFYKIQTYKLCCGNHQKMDQWGTMHWVLGDPDLQPTLSIPPKDIIVRDDTLSYKWSELTPYIFNVAENMSQPVSTYQIGRDTDSHPTLLMPPGNKLASNPASNYKMYGHTNYIVEIIRRWISQQLRME